MFFVYSKFNYKVNSSGTSKQYKKLIQKTSKHYKFELFKIVLKVQVDLFLKT